MTDLEYTLLVDETGIDGASKRVMYVGCLFGVDELTNVENAIIDFNKRCLDDPLYSGKPGLVNASNEPRHFSDDTESLRVKFIDEVLRTIPYRVYAVFDIPKATIRQSKIELFMIFIGYIRQVKEIGKLNIIVERSGADDKLLEKFGAEFRNKEYLPLSITDYYAAILHRFHQKRLEALETDQKLTNKDLKALAFSHYMVLVDRISFERDLSSGEISSRKDGRYFLDQVKGIVGND